MEEKSQQFLDKYKKLIDSFSGVTLLAYHFDIDGCAAASILWRIFKKENKELISFPATRGFESALIEKVKKENPDNVLIVDYIPSEELLNALKDYNVYIVDHHVFEERFEKWNYFTFAETGKNFSLSYWTYLLAKRYGIKSIDWLAKLGSYWDKCLEGTEFYYEGIYKKEMEEMLPFNILVNFKQIDGSKKIVEVFNQSNTLEDARDNLNKLPMFRTAKSVFDEELPKILASKVEFKDLNLSIFKIKTKFKHIRIYVDYITYTNKGTFIFLLDEGVRYKFSFRTTEDISLLKIVRRLSEEFVNFSGGGHEKACGAILMGTNIDEVIDKFIELYKEELEEQK